MADSFKPLSTDSFQPLQGPRAGGESPQLPTMPQLDAGHVLNKAVDFIRPFVGNAAGLGAAQLASGIPYVGKALALPAETQGYAGVDTLLQYLKTKDQRPNSFGEALGEGEKEALINAVGGRIMNGLFRGVVGAVKTIRNVDQPEIYKFAPTTSQALESFGYHAAATLPKFAEDVGASGAKAAAQDRAGGIGFTQALGFTKMLNGRHYTTNSDPIKLADKIRATLEEGFQSGEPQGYTPFGGKGLLSTQPSKEAIDILQGGRNPFSKLDEVIQDPERLAKVLIAGQGIGSNTKKDLAAYQFMKMINDSSSNISPDGVTRRIDPKKLSAMWNDPEMNVSFDVLYGKQGRKDVTDFLRNIAITQDAPTRKGIRYFGGGFALPMTYFIDQIAGIPHAAGFSGLAIGAGVMGHLLTSTKTARIVTAMAGGEPLSASQTYVSRALVDGLQGSTVALMDNEGNKTYGSFQKDPKDGVTKFVENR